MTPAILAFDTSGPHVAAALWRGDRIETQCAEDMARGQAERLIGLLEDLLSQACCGWNNLDALAVGIGPGNFTGIRIAVSTARGLGLGLDIPVYGVNGFEQRRLLLDTPTPVVPAPREQVYEMTSDGPAMRPLNPADLLLPPNFGAAIAGAIAEVAARNWPETPLPAAPLYARPADAAPPREAPPRILDDA